MVLKDPRLVKLVHYWTSVLRGDARRNNPLDTIWFLDSVYNIPYSTTPYSCCAVPNDPVIQWYWDINSTYTIFYYSLYFIEGRGLA